MNIPTKTDLKNGGYRMSVNADDALVRRSAQAVRVAYLDSFLTDEEIGNAEAGSEIAAAWLALTFLKYCQDVEFGTRTGGERKRFDYGRETSGEEAALKSECALYLKKLSKEYKKRSEIVDICDIYYKTQLLS